MIAGQADTFLGPFSPGPLTYGIAVTSSSSNTAFTPMRQVLVTNAGSTIAFVTFGTSSQTAAVPATGNSSNSVPILPGTARCFTPSIQGSNNIGAISSGTTTLYVTPGEGL